MPVDAINRIACKLGIHQWSDWEYLLPNRCDQRRVCLRCKFEERILIHNWGTYSQVKPCYKYCIRCKEQSTEENHTWEWLGIHPGKLEKNSLCNGQRICKVCKKIDKYSGAHKWGMLEELSQCESKCYCLFCCGYEENEYHSWDQGEYHIYNPDGWTVYTCTKCGEHRVD